MRDLKFLTPEQKKCYTENGYVKLSNVFSEAEMKEFSDEYDNLFDRKNKENAVGLEATWIGDDMKQLSENRGVSVKSIHNLQMHSAIFTRVILNPNLLDALEDVMDTSDILLHHTKAHEKPPEKGSPFLMHQDYPYFPYKNHTMQAVFIHLDDTTPENGGLAVYPGSHKLGPVENKTLIGDGNHTYHYVDPDLYPLSEGIPISAKKGEVLIFSYLLIHGSYLNLSNRTRRMFLVQVVAADDEPTKEKHKSPAQNLVMRGRNLAREANFLKRYDH